LDCDVLALEETGVLQALVKREGEGGRGGRRRAAQEPDDRQRLGAGRERPKKRRRRRAAQQRDDLASPHGPAPRASSACTHARLTSTVPRRRNPRLCCRGRNVEPDTGRFEPTRLLRASALPWKRDVSSRPPPRSAIIQKNSQQP